MVWVCNGIGNDIYYALVCNSIGMYAMVLLCIGIGMQWYAMLLAMVCIGICIQWYAMICNGMLLYGWYGMEFILLLYENHV